MELYDITVKDAKHNDIPLSDYRGKALLIVNTATRCGFTPQYDGLQKLYDAYRDKGFEVLDFPCNQFMRQAPGSEEEIASFCQLNFGITFKLFEKIEVNGKKESPLFTWLKEKAGGGRVKWNFTKFLVDRTGNVVGRFNSKDKPEIIAPAIEKVLG